MLKKGWSQKKNGRSTNPLHSQCVQNSKSIKKKSKNLTHIFKENGMGLSKQCSKIYTHINTEFSPEIL